MKSTRFSAVVALAVPAAVAAVLCAWPDDRSAVAAAPSDVAPTTAPAAVVVADVPLPRRGGATTLPATRPANRPSPFGGRLLRIRDVGLAGPPIFNGGGDDQPATDEQWQDIGQFAAKNFPNRWKAFESLRDRRGVDAPVVQAVRDRITGRYRLLMRIKEVMPDLYDAAVEQGRLEDAAWQAVIDSRRQPKNNALNQQKREKVGALVKDLLRERQERIDALKQSLKEEQEQLDADVTNVGQLIDQQIASLSGNDPSGRQTRDAWNGGGGGPFGGGGGGGGGGPWGGGGGRRWGDWQGPGPGQGPDRFRNRDPSTRPAATTRAGQ